MSEEEDLLRLLHSTESTFVERKVTSDGQDWTKTVVAFANTLEPSQKGVLFIGATDKGEIEQHTTDLDQIQKKLSDKIGRIFPQPYYETRVIKEDGRECLAVIVPGSPLKPHFAGPLYLRDGSKTVVASTAQYESLLASRTSKVHELQRWIGKQVTFTEYQTYAGVATMVTGNRSQATIAACNQFYVTVDRGNRKLSYPLERAVLSYDDGAKRLTIEYTPVETVL